MRSDSEDKKSIYKKELDDGNSVKVPQISNLDSNYKKYLNSPFGISTRSKVNS